MSKNVVLGVTGGIAAYKAPDIVNGLLACGYEVLVVMTENATRFIDPKCFKVKALWGMWERESGDIPHIEMADWADAMVVAPATANIIGKFANGIADDLLSTNHLALDTDTVKIIYPTMNTRMFEHPAVQYNMKALAFRGWDVQLPDSGMLQCGTKGLGKMPKPRAIVEHVHAVLSGNIEDDDYKGRPVYRAKAVGEKFHEYMEECIVRLTYLEK